MRPNVLVVCGRNKKRSRTAEYIFKNDSRFSIRSAGLSPKSNRKISEDDLKWANLILVMEAKQKSKVREMYTHITIPLIEVLNIEDDYEFLDEELQLILTERINDTLRLVYNL